MKKLHVLDVFTYDFDSQLLRTRSWISGEFSRYPTVSRRVFQWIDNGSLHLQPYIQDLCIPGPRLSITPTQLPNMTAKVDPFCHKLLFPDRLTDITNNSIPINSIQYYKKLL